VLHKQSEEPNMSNITKLERLERAGHVLRMDGERTPKRVPESDNAGKRSLGKPKY
jgi:hypothetical protein